MIEKEAVLNFYMFLIIYGNFVLILIVVLILILMFSWDL